MSVSLIDRLPDDALRLVFTFLKAEDGDRSEDRVVLATARVCRSWQKNVVLGEERQESATRLEYPRDMVQVFYDSHAPIFQLPVLDLGGRGGGTGYIDFIKPEQMGASVMRFRDCLGRPGVALKIRANPEIGERLEGPRWNRSQNDLIVLAIFKRYASPESHWTYGWGGSDTAIEYLYNERHHANGHVGHRLATCPECPFGDARVHISVLSNLLHRRDPDFMLP